MKSFSSTECFNWISILRKSSASVHRGRRELSLNRQPWRKNQRPETLTWYSSKDAISHQPDRKQIETGSKTVLETNDGQACWVIWHCLIGLFSLPLAHVLMVDTAASAQIHSALCYLMVRSLLKTAVITISYESICPSIRGNSQKAWRENRDWIMRAETIKKLEGS